MALLQKEQQRLDFLSIRNIEDSMSLSYLGEYLLSFPEDLTFNVEHFTTQIKTIFSNQDLEEFEFY